jgi:hypothetical protein
MAMHAGQNSTLETSGIVKSDKFNLYYPSTFRASTTTCCFRLRLLPIATCQDAPCFGTMLLYSCSPCSWFPDAMKVGRLGMVRDIKTAGTVICMTVVKPPRVFRLYVQQVLYRHCAGVKHRTWYQLSTNNLAKVHRIHLSYQLPL